MPLRIIFFGTPELARISLTALTRSGCGEVVAVVTQPDKPKGRDLRLTPSPVKMAAEHLGLPVLQPLRARQPEFLAQLAEFNPDLIVVAAYGQILPQTILDLPRHGCINVHTSLLPKYRGAAPIQWSILDDQSETGVTIMKMDAGLDTGAILTQRATPIQTDDDAPSLHDRLARIGAELLVETIPPWVGGTIVPRPQPCDGISHARKISKEDGRLNWGEPARRNWNRVRALTPWPGAFTFMHRAGAAQLLKIWKCECVPVDAGPAGTILRFRPEDFVVACGSGGLRLIEVQREGGRRLGMKEYLAGHPLGAETHFSGGAA